MIKFEAIAGGVVDDDVFVDRLKKEENTVSKLKQYKMTEWLDLPEKMLPELPDILNSADDIRGKADCLVCLGIGGSYLGGRAILGALDESEVEILFAGNSFSEVELNKVLKKVRNKDFVINVISKSGTTRETALAFRIFKEELINRYGKEEAYKRIYATTDGKSGALHDEAEQNGYKTFVIPDGAGGRYSVLSAVGLLPLAVAGIDIKSLLEGAIEEKADLEEENKALNYAVMRNLLYEAGYKTEVFANFEPSWMYFNEWLKQLFGESEGKEGKGIFPAAVEYSTDLHSMGQYMQEGRRDLFETFVEIPNLKDAEMRVPAIDGNDGLGDLENMRVAEINRKALEATEAAHLEGGVPILKIILPSWDAKGIGALIFFFEMSCALSGLILGVDPFNQPGVENYKSKMKDLLQRGD